LLWRPHWLLTALARDFFLLHLTRYKGGSFSPTLKLRLLSTPSLPSMFFHYKTHFEGCPHKLIDITFLSKSCRLHHLQHLCLPMLHDQPNSTTQPNSKHRQCVW
jgi:hypothetical protein